MNQDPLDTAQRIAYLVTGFIRNDLSLPERQELDGWIAEREQNMQLFIQLTDQKNILEAKQWFDLLDEKTAFQRFNAKIRNKKKARIAKIHPAWIAAACLVIIIGLSVIWYSTSPPPSYATLPQKNDTVSKILPGTKKAVLITEPGKVIDLSQPENSRIPINGGHPVINTNAVLLYDNHYGLAVLHTLQTPRGGEYQLVLPDGTKVWLNAASSLIYPTAFGKDGRKVTLQGEAYFEVAHDAHHPFEVTSGTTTVRVIGTHFNVNAYPKMPQLISLLEGKVQVEKERNKSVLLPGQQAIVDDQGPIAVSKNNHIQTSIAWTKGKFSFDQTPLPEVMQQLSRWYDVEVEYQDNTLQEFTGEIYRNSSLNDILRMLQLSTGEHFDIQGKLITVRP